MKKRILTVLAVLLAVSVLVLSGCAGGSGGSGGDQGTSDDQAEPSGDGSEVDPYIPNLAFVFTTEDLDGNELTSEEIFGASEYTMVNCWASWCGPCVGELPELAKLSEEFAGKGCAIIGVLFDADDPAGLEDGKELLADAGAKYLNVKPWDSLMTDMNIQAIPTSFFVDRQGKVVGSIVIGAYPEQYTEILDSLLD